MTSTEKTELTVQAEVNPTEDPEKVKVAIFRLFGEIPLDIIDGTGGKAIFGRTQKAEALSKFHDLLRRERILDAARKVLSRGRQGKSVRFYLNKQVAYVGHVSFSEPVGESPLGPIYVEIICNDAQKMIDWLVPKTFNR